MSLEPEERDVNGIRDLDVWMKLKLKAGMGVTYTRLR